MEEFRAEVTRFINRTGRTQQSLANELGVSRSRVAQWCSGNADISRTDCGRLIKAGMTFAELFGQDVEDYVSKVYSGGTVDLSSLTDEECSSILERGLARVLGRRLPPEGGGPSRR